jgi:hypothetical protein
VDRELSPKPALARRDTAFARSLIR